MTNRPVIAFTSVRAPYGWLGNMSPYPLTVEVLGLRKLSGTWRTAEALFQAARFDDLAIREEIRACRSPMQAKMIAKRNAQHMVVEPRGSQDLAHMEQILRLKIGQHPDLRRQLSAIPNETRIVEDVTTRGVSAGSVFWGAALINGEWVGENRLGCLWMGIRKDPRTADAQTADAQTADAQTADAQIDMFRCHDDRSVAAAAFNNNNNNDNDNNNNNDNDNNEERQ